MRRHDLVFVQSAAWRAQVAARPELVGDRLVADWVDHGWPLIRRRATCEATRVALGLPLPPFGGKRRLSFLVEREDIISSAPPPTLSVVRRSAPRRWRSTLDALDALAIAQGVEARVFGSLAWRAITGLSYLTSRSDLDVVLYVELDTDLHVLTRDLAAIEAWAPMRLDGELMRGDGAAVSWREVHSGARELLVKSIGDVRLIAADNFLLEAFAA